MKRIEEMIKEAREFGTCYVGSWSEDFCEQTGKLLQKIERYATKNGITTDYIMQNEECYLKVK